MKHTKRLVCLMLLLLPLTIFARKRSLEPIMMESGIEFTVDNYYTGSGKNSFYLEVSLKNTTDSIVNFDSEQIEIVTAEGFTYYSITKDRNFIATGLSIANLITTISLDGGRATRGVIHISTPMGEAEKREAQLYVDETIVLLD